MSDTMKKIFGAAARLAAFCAMFAGGTALADGAIRSITPVATEQHSFPNLDDPVRVGEEVKFDILLFNKRAADQDGRHWDEAYTNNWVIRYRGSGDATYDEANSPLKLGVIVNGKLRQADISLTPHETYPYIYTVMHVTYKAQAGDLAMPLLLADRTGQAAPNSDSVTYYLFNANLWKIVDASNGEEMQFSFGNQGQPNDADNALPLQNEEVRDYNLSLAGIYINTVDFDTYYEDGDTWRKIYRGMTETFTSRLPSIVVPGGTSAGNSGATVYLWVADTNCVTLATDGQSVKWYGDGANAHLAYPVSLLSGQTNVTFRLRGVTADTETTVYMSAFPTNIYDGAGNLIENFVSRKVSCIASPDPFVRFTLNDGDSAATVTADSAYNTPKARLTVELSEAYTAPVTIKLNPVVKTSSDDVFADSILGISMNSEAANYKDTVSEVTIEAGRTSATVQIFALGATAETQSYGIEFTPSLEGEAAAFYKGEKRACILYVNDSIPSISEPAAGVTIAQTFTAGVTNNVTLKVVDSYSDANAGGWTATYRDIENPEVADTVTGIVPKFNSTTGLAELAVPLELYSQPTSRVAVAVTDPNGNTSAEVEFLVNVVAPKEVQLIIGDDDQNYGAYSEGDVKSVKARLSQKYNKGTLYVWLEGANQTTKDAIAAGLIVSGAFNSRSLIIQNTGVDSQGNIAITFKDGCAATADLQFRAVLTKTDDRNGDVCDDYIAKVFFANVENIAPMVTGVKVNNGGEVTANGGTSGASAAKDVATRFTISRLFEPGEIDRTNIVSRWTVRDGREGAYFYRELYATGSLASTVCEYTFNVGNVTQEVSVAVQDKDMPGTVEEWSEEFKFWVNVTDVPRVTLTPYRAGAYGQEIVADYTYLETEQGSRAWIEVALSNVADVPLNVLLTVTPLSPSDPGTLGFSTYDVTFPAGTISRRVTLSELDGTRGSGSRGFEIVGAVTNTSENAAYNKPWNEYFTESEVLQLAIVNKEPIIVSPVETTVTNRDVTAGIPFTIDWQISDVDADLTNGMRIVWSAGGQKQEFKGNDLEFGTFTNTFNVSLSGLQTVTMQVWDKDGGTTNRVWYYYLDPSKKLYLTPYGPYANSNSKYNGISGLGRGRVFADGKSPVLTRFQQMWNYDVRATSAGLYAKGYSIGEVDNGTLDDTDYPVRPTGASAMGADGVTPTGPFYTYDGAFANGDDATYYDSFFYCWIDYSDPATPVYYAPSPNKSGSLRPKLPEYQEGSLSYADIVFEAIFSREWLPLDNCGDINQDGVPDAYHQLYWPTQADGGAATGGTDENITDITPVWNRNDDEDYLPADVTAGINLIPGLTNSWVNTDRAFNARLEIRGFGDGLNSAGEGRAWSRPSNVRPGHGDFSDSQAEMIAYELATNQNAAAIGTWHAERPTNPTLADTDGDGLPDGYEYWYWYNARAGWIDDDGDHHFLTGERYNPLHPEKGDIISAADIMAAFDPVTPYRGAASRDLDNDGIPDLMELELGTNPINWDTDGDGLPDGWESLRGTNPLKADSAANPDGDMMAFMSMGMRVFSTIVNGETEHYAVTWPVDMSEDTRLDRTETPTNGWLITPRVPQGNLQRHNGIVTEVKTLVSTVKPKTFTSATGRLILLEAIGEANLFVPYATDTAVYRGAPSRLEAGTVLSAEPEETEWTMVTIKKAEAEEAAGDGDGGDGDDGDGETGTPVAEKTPDAKTAAERYFKIWEYGKTGTFAMGREAMFAGEREVFINANAEPDNTLAVTVGLMHWQVYQHVGFDPRTAWGWAWLPTVPQLNPRWSPSSLRSTLLDPQKYMIDNFTPMTVSARDPFALPINTRAYANRDEFLLQQFLVHTGTIGASQIQATTRRTFTGTIWPDYTTVPIGTEQGQNANGDTIYSGGDSDGDSVPDGWELYVMAGPNSTTNKMAGAVFTDPESSLEKDGYGEYSLPAGSSVFRYNPMAVPYNRPGRMFFKPPSGFSPGDSIPAMSPLVGAAQNATMTDTTADGDGLSEAGEFAGTDVVALFGSDPSIHTRCATADAEWLNKFWPTDPWNADTDGDGLTDGNERDNLYGTPADNGEICIAGGGLNPNSVDTDIDGLPDMWEVQYMGKTGEKTTVSGNETNTVATIVGGMDGTYPDAYTWQIGDDRDYDHDGLQNWQEYIAGALRCFRYDDLYSSWGILTEKEFTDEFGIVNTQQWYAAAIVDGRSPNVLPDQFDWAAAYFSPVGNGFDMVNSVKYMWHDGPDHTGFGRKIVDTDLRLNIGSPLKFPSGYIGCSPTAYDSDGDGMDDYWELFHGLNPLLGSPASEGGAAKDLIFDMYNERISALDNPWTYDTTDGSFWTAIMAENANGDGDARLRNIAEAKGENKPWDFTTYLWMNGAASADPDGDDIRNQQEAVLPNMQAPSTWLHTDPSPLWMTDTSYTNSLVYRYYKTINRPSFMIFDTRSEDVSRTWTTWYATNIIQTEYGVSTNIEEHGSWVEDRSFEPLPIEVERQVDITIYTTNYNISASQVTEMITVPHPYVPGETITLPWTHTVEVTNGFEVVSETVTTNMTYSLSPQVPAYSLNYWGVTSGYLFEFEENEGYDTDNDGLSDGTEIAAGVTAATDSQDFDDPVRRQAMYFTGAFSAMESRTNPRHGLDTEMFFHQFTVELWAKPEETGKEQTLIERTTVYPSAHTQDGGYMRRNFQIGITAEGLWFASYDSKGTDVTAGGTTRITGTAVQAGKWTHLAMSYDGDRLRLYVNGTMVKSIASNVQPANGVEIVSVDGEKGLNGYSYVGEHALLLGASAAEPEALSIEKSKPTWLAYDKFYKGYIDEVRVWDGARPSEDIQKDMNVRYTKTEAAENRMEIYRALMIDNRRRYITAETQTLGELPPELVYHYSFDSVFGATAPEYVATAPYGFAWSENEAVRNRSGYSRPESWTSTWWDELPVKSTVYTDYAYLTWAQNTMTHLPLFDGTTRDSRYWSTYYAGATTSGSAGVSKFAFKRTAEPYGWYNKIEMSPDAPPLYSTQQVLAGADSDLRNLRNFTQRSEFADGTDLIPLGGVYARTSEDMWDGNGPSTLWTATGVDENQNGLPDWWELYVRANPDVYSNLPDEFTATAKVTRDGQEMTLAEAYMRDLAAGSTEEFPEGDPALVQFGDADADGLPDWWELLYGIAGESALDDSDNDQLSNFAEYLIAEAFSKYGFPLVRPDAMATFGQLVPDYFLKVGRLYLGEMFSDHDFMEDWWEDMQPVQYSSRFHFDSVKDWDDDCWSNYSEARYDMQVRPISAQLRGHYDSDGNYVRDFPLPTIHVAVDYIGTRRTQAEKSRIVIEASRDPAFADGAEAIFVASNAAANASGNDEMKYRGLGNWRAGSAVGSLAPGNVDSSTLELQMARSSSSGVYTWSWADCQNRDGHGHPAGSDYESGTYEEYQQAKLRCDAIKLVQGDMSWFPVDDMSIDVDSNEITANFRHADFGNVGHVDLQTGSFDVDMSLLANATANRGAEDELDVVHAKASRLRIAYKVNTAVGMPRTVHLESPEEGYLREGTNYFRAFADLNEDGVWTPGEPYGCAAPYGTDVSWREASLAITLSDTNPSVMRIDLNGAVAANEYNSLIALNDRDAAGHERYPNWATSFAGTNMPPQNSMVRMRIVRTMINDLYSVYMAGSNNSLAGSVEGVVFDGTINLARHPFFTEADLLALGQYDLDWGTLQENWTDTTDGLHQSLASFANVTNVMYRITVGDATASNFETNNIVGIAFRNGFELGLPGAQTPCEPVSPAGIITSGRPTFKWRHDNTINKDYPAFRLRVWNAAGSTLVYDSGVQRAPARTQDGEYIWEAPLYVGSPTALGHIFETTNNYQWAVSMLDAKFTTVNNTEVRRAFRVNTSGNMAGQSDHGTIECRVKYFGPGTVAGGIGPSRIIRVQAYTSPDFSGYPVSEGWVNDTTGIDSTTNSVVNAKIIGLPPGTYYLRAFIDTNGDTARSKWESWGYANYVGSTRKQVYDPRPFTLRLGSNERNVADIYIEDMDTDNDGYPDIWEYESASAASRASNEFLNQRGPASGPTYYTQVNTNLVNTLAAYDISGYTEFLTFALAADGSADSDGDGLNDFAELVLGTDPLATEGATATQLGASLSAITSPTQVAFKVVAGEVTAAPRTLGSGKRLMYSANALAAAAETPAKVTWRLEYTPALDKPEWTVVAEGTVSLKEGQTEADVASEARKAPNFNEKSGFYRVIVK